MKQTKNKLEARNPKFETISMLKIRNFQKRVSDFDIRISDFFLEGGRFYGN